MNLHADMPALRRGAFVLALLFPSILAAQTATLSIGVVDTGGKTVSDVTVTAVNTSTGQSRQEQTNKVGVYIFALSPGTYKVTASAAGFEPSAPVTVPVNGQSNIDFVLVPIAKPKPSAALQNFTPGAGRANPQLQARLDQRTSTSARRSALILI